MSRTLVGKQKQKVRKQRVWKQKVQMNRKVEETIKREKLNKLMTDDINKIIGKMSKGQKSYESKRAVKKGFKSLDEYIQSKLDMKTNQLRLKRIEEERLFWKKKQSDFYPELRGTETGNHPCFDMRYWIKKYNPEYKEGVSTKSSKEMMEWFLRYLGVLSIQDFGEELTPQVWLAWSELLNPTTKDALPTRDFLERVRWFVELEHLIENDEMFYALFIRVWTYGSYAINNKEIEKIFSRYGRNQLSFEKRMESSDALLCLGFEFGDNSSKWLSHDGMSNKDFTYMINESFPDYVTVYRSFKVKKDQMVRQSNEKFIDENTSETNPLYYQQNAGKGWSYSLDKHSALRLGWNINAFHFEKYLGMNEKQSLRHLRRKGFVAPSQVKDDVTLGSGYYTCIGTYLVKKEDILLATDSRSEMEILANPENVKLFDYYFLNLIDYFTTKFVRSYSGAFILENEENDKSIRMMNENLWFDYFRPLVSLYLRENPSQYIEILKNGFRQSYFKEMGDFCTSYYEDAQLSHVSLEQYRPQYGGQYGSDYIGYMYFADDEGFIYKPEDDGRFRPLTHPIKLNPVGLTGDKQPITLNNAQ